MPATIPTEIAGIARDTLGAAVGAAQQLPPDLSRILISVAQDAFVQGLHLAALIAGVVAIGAAVMVVVLLSSTSARSPEIRK